MQGLLQAKGETRGRHYLGSPELRRLYADVRSKHRSRVVDPYEALKPIPAAINPEPEGATLF